MSSLVNLPHPQRLYAALRAQASPELRARAVFEFLCTLTGAERGFLFLSQGLELVCAASSPGAALSAAVRRQLDAVWQHELDREPDDGSLETLDVKTIEALRKSKPELTSNTLGGVYQRRMLSTYRGPRWLPVGIALLKARDTRELTPIRQVHVAAICNALIDAGDVVELHSESASG
jgi:hypothetical protein